jgi:arylsulfatase A-like enzyme
MTGKQKSIVLVTVDCLRADHVGFMGYKRPTTPFLDSLAEESIVVPNAIVAGAPTYYSLPAILASRYPLALGRDVLGLGPDECTLTSSLKQGEYATAAFTAANPYISRRFGYDQGFDTFHDYLQDEPERLAIEDPNSPPAGLTSQLNRHLQKILPALGPLAAVYDELYFRYCQRITPVGPSLDALRRFPSADVIIDQAQAWIESVGEAPFFLWLHLMDPHSPYYPKEEALELMGETPITPFGARYLNSSWNRSDLGPRRMASRRNDIVALYDAGIRWVDSQLQRLIGMLRDSRRWDDCIFTLTADHGEEFLEHGGRYHSPSRLIEELIHVPLLLRVPGCGKREVSSTPFSLIHLAPTLLDAANRPIPANFEGVSHWSEFQSGSEFDRLAISECVAGCSNPFHPDHRIGSRVLSVRDVRFKLVLFFDPRSEQLYDLETDPGEESPLPANAERTVRCRLLNAAREHLRHSISSRDDRVRVQARLRELQLKWKKPADKASPVSFT